MNIKDLLRNNPFTIAIIVVATLISGVTFVFSKTVALIELIIVIALVVAALKWISHSAERKKDLLRSLEASISQSGDMGKYTSSFPFPLLIVDNDGNVQWFNSSFDVLLEGYSESYTNNISEFIPDIYKKIINNDYSATDILCGEKKYTVYISRVDANTVSLYFVDDTILKDIRTEFDMTRPAVLLLNIDSLDNAEETLDHADFYAVVSDVERIITKWLVKNKCVFRKFADGKFMALTESANLDVMIKNKFQILDEIRTYTYDNKEMDITLSVGIGRDNHFSECEISARHALDMARGRGGDQVAVKLGENYEFFGGLTSRKEKRGKIKSRVISAALSEYIEKCNSVYVMGHKYSDFDVIGAAIGISAIVKSHDKNVNIVVNESNTLASALISYLKSCDNKINFVTPDAAVASAGHDSLVVVVDTMRSQLVEAPELLDISGQIILIDHHRKSVDYIDGAKLAFQEPYASSACEMVAELVQYSPHRVKLHSYEAEALLSGILLDTKNYTLRVGVRTFAAAAILKDQKADTVTVRKLFAATAEENIAIARLIAQAEYFDRYAIAFAENDENISRLISSKTADEMLSIEGVDASFVIAASGETVFVSARSLGKINVQLIMEKFGGGGHQSMAACQISGKTVSEVKELLRNEINLYLEVNS